MLVSVENTAIDCFVCAESGLFSESMITSTNRDLIFPYLLELVVQQCRIDTGIVCDDNVFRFEIGINVGDTVNLFEDTGHGSLTSPAAIGKITIVS